MQYLFAAAAVIAGVLGIAAPAQAQFQDDTVTSDSFGNTASGKQALNALTPTEESSLGCSFYPGPCSQNSAFGYQTLGDDTSGSFNSAFGTQALIGNTTGNANTAVGASAMEGNTSGTQNTAVGVFALGGNGSNNTAVGYNSLFDNYTGSNNTATGYETLYQNSSGAYNVASGFEALYSNKNGTYNTALGTMTLIINSSGSYNSALGYSALFENQTGQQNTAGGVQALRNNTTGSYNSAFGVDSLNNNTTGSTNIALGYKAGFDITTGSNNIDIGNAGSKTDNGVIRIGSTQTSAFIAGIFGASVTGAAVVVNSNGQLGVTSSSERFKTDIAPMVLRSERLAALRPVTFHYKSDPHGALQYGLIAEQVAQVYPDLVVRDKEGRVLSVRYDELAPMLLNVVQRQERNAAALTQEVRLLKEQLANYGAKVSALQKNADGGSGAVP